MQCAKWPSFERSFTALCLLASAACSSQGGQASVCHPGVEAVATSAAGAACAPMQVRVGVCNVQGSGFTVSQYAWSDDACMQRTAELVPNTVQDPFNMFGGYMRRYTYAVDGNVRDCVGTTGDAPGFGWLVNHFNAGQSAADSRWAPGSASETVFQGSHHAVHQYTWDYPIGGKIVRATVQWLFATGRAHPLWAVTFDTSRLAAGSVSADSRAPYGAFGWDGGVNANVDGIGWGDHNKFVTLQSPVTLGSGWDYTEANTVPFDRTWSAAADAEMGSVQTQTYTQHDAGGFFFYSSRGTTSPGGPMPDPTNWPFQINQYELPYQASKKIAWGTNFGAVGQTGYPSYDGNRTLVGAPYQSYSVHVVLGKHSDNPVLGVVSEEESNQATTFTATNATVDPNGPAGVARTDTQPFTPAGYNPVYGTWDAHLVLAGQPVTLVLNAGAATLHHPMFVVHNWQGLVPDVTLNGQALTADTNFFASLDVTQKNLWLTLGSDVTGTATLGLN